MWLPDPDSGDSAREFLFSQDLAKAMEAPPPQRLAKGLKDRITGHAPHFLDQPLYLPMPDGGLARWMSGDGFANLLAGLPTTQILDVELPEDPGPAADHLLLTVKVRGQPLARWGFTEDSHETHLAVVGDSATLVPICSPGFADLAACQLQGILATLLTDS